MRTHSYSYPHLSIPPSSLATAHTYSHHLQGHAARALRRHHHPGLVRLTPLHHETQDFVGEELGVREVEGENGMEGNEDEDESVSRSPSPSRNQRRRRTLRRRIHRKHGVCGRCSRLKSKQYVRLSLSIRHISLQVSLAGGIRCTYFLSSSFLHLRYPLRPLSRQLSVCLLSLHLSVSTFQPRSLHRTSERLLHEGQTPRG